MKVEIGNTIIPDAEIKRFIDLQSGLALSMIRVSYEGEAFKELGEAFNKQMLLPLECEILKTNVLVHGSSHDERTKKHEYVFLERAIDVSCGYKLLHTKVVNERAIIVPENVKDAYFEDAEKLRTLPYIRFILKKGIPKDWFEQ